MIRTEWTAPAVYPFETVLEVRISDVNYGGHVGNDAWLSLLQEARLRFLEQHGMSERDVGGCGLLMIEAHIQYRAQAFRGDRLRVGVALAGLEPLGFDLYYRALRESDRVEVIRARTTMVFYDYGRRRIARMPKGFVERLGSASVIPVDPTAGS